MSNVYFKKILWGNTGNMLGEKENKLWVAVEFKSVGEAKIRRCGVGKESKLYTIGF